MGGICSSGFVSTAADVLEMSGVRGVRGVGVWFVRGRRCGRVEWEPLLGLDFTNPVGTRGVWCICLCLGCSGVGGPICTWVLTDRCDSSTAVYAVSFEAVMLLLSHTSLVFNSDEDYSVNHIREIFISHRTYIQIIKYSSTRQSLSFVFM